MFNKKFVGVYLFILFYFDKKEACKISYLFDWKSTSCIAYQDALLIEHLY